MRRLLCICIALGLYLSAQAKMDTVRNAAQLEALFSSARDTIKVYLLPGDYHLTPKQGVDSALSVVSEYTRDSIWALVTALLMKERDTATDSAKAYPDSFSIGSIVDSLIRVRYTYGLRISGKIIHIKGAPAYASVIYTHSGYGLFFLNCKEATLEGVIITGGERDPDARAMDAGVVAVNSKVKLLDNLIFANEGDTALLRRNIVGIMGICAREGSYVFAFNNQIARNSWHGIAVYRDASATITGNLIDGVDKSNDNELGGGRGIGILVTRNGKATVETNVIKRYSRGIGIFVNADVLVSENLIEDINIWGINVWDADTGRPSARIEKNVIFKTGACGAAIIRYLEGKNDPGYFRNNIIVESTQNRDFDVPNKYCFQCALAVHGRPEGFIIENNIFYKNTWIAPCFTNMDKPLYEFIEILQTQYSSLPLRWYAGYSEFIQRFFFYVEKQ